MSSGAVTSSPPPAEPEDAAMLDLLERPRAARVLRALAVRGHLNQRGFAEASDHSPEQAKALRDALEQCGVLAVRALPGHGRAGVKEIRLTPMGREIAEHLAAIEDIVRRRPRRDPPA